MGRRVNENGKVDRRRMGRWMMGAGWGGERLEDGKVDGRRMRRWMVGGREGGW